MDEHYHEDQRSSNRLSHEEWEAIVQAAATRAAPIAREQFETEFYAEIGKGFIKKALLLIGTGLGALFAWLKAKGLI